MKTVNNSKIELQNTTTTNWFRTAAPYIHTHRNATFVIAFDGETIRSANFDSLLHDLALLTSLGIKLVIAFGARPQIEQQCEAENIPLNYHHNLRVTDDAGLQIAKSVSGQLRLEIEAKLSFSLPHTPMADSSIHCISGNLVTAQPVGIKDGINFEHTGQVRRIDTASIEQQLQLGNIVLLPPLGYSPTGEVFNLSARDVATEAAIALQADKLIFIGDAYPALAYELTLAQAKQALKEDTLTLSAITKASHAGVQRIHLLDRSIDGALLQELFSRDGAGTLISASAFELSRQATIEDVGGVLELISPLEEKGVLVKRSRDRLEMEIEQFTILERDGSIVACAALYPYPDNNIAELACLAVAEDYQGGGRGEQLLNTLEQQAKSAGLLTLCVLTTQTTHWFIEHGFKAGEISDLPIEKQQLYNFQRNAVVLTKNLS